MGSRKRENVQKYFEYYCEVTPPSTQISETVILFKFPTVIERDDLLESAVKFIYPFEFERNFLQHFSFVLTDLDAKFTYGYCRHDPHTNSASFFLSHIEHHDEFYKFLDEIASMKRSYPVVSAAYSRRYEGELFQLDHYLRNIQTTAVDSYTPHKLPRIPENRNLTDYFSAVDSQAMVGMFAALLHERRVIVRSKNPSRLSACVQAANDLLYPLVWQHIFIPVLPESLVDYLSAPMPFLIGVSETTFLKLTPVEIGEVVVLDADRNSFTTPFDDLSSLSIELQSSLRRTIKNQELGKDTVSRAFLKAIVQIIGGYEAAIKLIDGNLIFDKDIFLSGSKNSMRNFRTQLLMTQTFQQFIEERLSRIVNGDTRSDEFEREYAIWESFKNSRSTGNRRISSSAVDLLRNVKERTQPAMDTAVESVRQGGREVKQAFQDIKSRIETTSHNTRTRLRMTKRNISRPSSHLSGNVDALNLPGTSKTLVNPGTSDFMTQSLDFTKISTTSSPKSNFESYIREMPLRSSPPPKPSPLRVIPLVIPKPKSSHNLIELNEPSTPGVAPPVLQSPKSPNGKTMDLIQLDDQSTPTRQQETDLLGEYGIDFEKFKISRNNWTTFE